MKRIRTTVELDLLIDMPDDADPEEFIKNNLNVNVSVNSEPAAVVGNIGDFTVVSDH